MTYRLFPAPAPAPASDDTVLVEVPASVAAYAVALLENVKYKPLWLDDNAYVLGVQAITRLQVALMSDAGGRITTAIDRLYMLLDQALNGRTYIEEVQGDGTILPFPALQAVPPQVPNGIGVAPGLRAQMLAAQGQINTGWFDGPARPATLADLAQAARLNGDGDQGIIPNAIEEVLLAVANGSSVADAVSGLLGGIANAATDGGLAAVQVATTGLLATQIGALSLGLQQVIDALALQTQRLTYLTGSVQPDANTIGAFGLPAYLAAGFGTLNELNAEGTYLLQRLGIIGDITASSLEQQTLSNARLQVVATRLAQLLGVEAVSDPIVGQSLLALAACICEQTTQINGKTPALPPPDPPTANCSGYEGISRFAGGPWAMAGSSGDGNIDYYFTFVTELEATVDNVFLQSSQGAPYYQYRAGINGTICTSFDVGADTNVLGLGVRIANTLENLYLFPATEVPGPPISGEDAVISVVPEQSTTYRLALVQERVGGSPPPLFVAYYAWQLVNSSEI